MRLTLSILAVLTLSMLFANQAEAGFIQADTALASSELGSDYVALNTINGSGLTTGFGPTDAHDVYAAGNHWTSSGVFEPTDDFITWGFTTPQVLDTIYIWNNYQPNDPPADGTGNDVTLFDLTLFDASNSVLLTLNDVTLIMDTATAQSFSFITPIANVSSVRFDVEAVEASIDTGLAEVGFNNPNVPVIPEPSSLLLFAFGATGLIGYARRRRESESV